MTDSQSPPETPQAVLCPQCGHTLGLSTPATLTIGNARFHQTVTLECAHCHTQRRWRPSATSQGTD